MIRSVTCELSRKRKTSGILKEFDAADDCLSVSEMRAPPATQDHFEDSCIDEDSAVVDFCGNSSLGNSVLAYNRKEKSLGELCRRFLLQYGIEGKGVLYLDKCTKDLSVERRRIYDIINILESFSVIRRRAKNEYQWRGIHKIVMSIQAQIASCVSQITSSLLLLTCCRLDSNKTDTLQPNQRRLRKKRLFEW